MRYLQIIWDLDEAPDGNVQHIAEHDLTKEEVEEVLLAAAKQTTSLSSGLPAVFGWTSTGRHIVVVFEQIGATIARPVTAYDVPPEQAPPQRKRKKR